MSTNLYEVAADWGNYAAKIARDGSALVIRNVAAIDTGQDDTLRDLHLFDSSLQTGNGDYATHSARIRFGDQQWLIGEAAYLQTVKAYERTTYARYGTDEWMALVAASFASLYNKRSGAIALTFNLPVSQFRAGRYEEIRDLLTGMWTIQYDGRDLVYEVLPDLIDAVPEGFGSLAYCCLSEDGRRFTNRDLAASRVVLMDFGGYTLDINTYNSLALGPYNESITTGLINVRNQVNRELKRLYNRSDLPGNILDEVIRTGQYRHAGGHPADVSSIVETALVGMMKDALRAWHEDLNSGADYDAVILTGGGGPLIAPFLIPQLGHQNVITVPLGEAHLANALGALRHRKFKREYQLT